VPARESVRVTLLGARALAPELDDRGSQLLVSLTKAVDPLVELSEFRPTIPARVHERSRAPRGGHEVFVPGDVSRIWLWDELLGPLRLLLANFAASIAVWVSSAT
jgi:hypothetical protein